MAASKSLVAAGSNAVASIDRDQTLKASKALLAHTQKVSKQKAQESSKRDLLAAADADDDDNENGGDSESLIWLTLTTKRHVADKARLQPGKIPLPHSLNTDKDTTVCLITADPQRAYKDIVASEEFPAELRKRVTRVIDITKLKAKYSQYEAQRKLFSEHDVFLGDDRIINRLPKVLGKTFYKTTAKRPIPVVLTPKARKVNGKRTKPQKKEGQVNAATPAEIAKEIVKALSSALVSLTPSTNTAVRIGYCSFTPEQIADNVNAVANALVEKWIPQKWRNVKSIYIKGQDTVALPIWLTDELWLDNKDVIPNGDKPAKDSTGKKRKSLEEENGGSEPVVEEEAPAPKKRAKKADAKPVSNDDVLDKQISDRKARLRKQKAGASKALDE